MLKGAAMDFETIRKLKDCCAREAALRVNVYPKWVKAGKMTQEKADEEIRLMQIAATCFNKILKGNIAFLNASIKKFIDDLKEQNKECEPAAYMMSGAIMGYTLCLYNKGGEGDGSST